MDVIELVKKDHDHVEALFARFKGGGGLTGLVRRVTGNVTARERKAALGGICHELAVHTRVEEEVLYPAIRATGDTELNRQVDEAVGEHARVKEMVAELAARLEGDDLDSRVSELESCVQHHVREEENEMLPRVSEVIPETTRVELGRQMLARKRALNAGARPAARSVRRRAVKSTATAAARTRRKTTAASARSKAKAKSKRRRAQ